MDHSNEPLTQMPAIGIVWGLGYKNLRPLASFGESVTRTGGVCIVWGLGHANRGCLRRRLRYRAAGVVWGLGMRDDAAFFVWGGLATRTGPVGTRHPCQRCARRVVVGLATASTSTLRSPCCRWACHDIHVDVALAVLSLGLPLHPWDIRIDVGLAGCHWALPESRGGKRG